MVGDLGNPDSDERIRPRRRSSERSLRHIVDATSSVVGDRFMNLLVATCATTLGAGYAFITETTADPDVSRVVAFWDDGTVRTDIAYPIAGTPAGAIQSSGEVVMYRRDVASRFPALAWLAESGIESFAGVPLHASDGQLIGQFGILARRSELNIHETEEVLRELAGRVEAELERSRLIRELRERERVLHLVVEHANDVLYRLEARRVPRLTYISPAVEQLSGYPAEAFMRDRFLFFRMVDHAERNAFTRMLMQEHRTMITVPWSRPDGSILSVEYSNAVTLDDDGRVVAIDGVIRDVTQRVALENDLRAAKQRERDVISAIPDLVFRIGADGTYLEYFGPEGAPLLVPPEQVPGQQIAHLLPEELAIPVLRAIHTALATGTAQRLEYPIEIAGIQRYHEARIVPAGPDEVLAFVRDFTAERHMAREEEHRVARDELETRVESQMENGSRYGLTFRELTVLHHVSRGLADKEIAEALGISAYTVNKHVASILSKMHVSSRTAAGVQAVREGLLT